VEPKPNHNNAVQANRNGWGKNSNFVISKNKTFLKNFFLDKKPFEGVACLRKPVHTT